MNEGKCSTKNCARIEIWPYYQWYIYEIEIDHLIPIRRPGLVIMNKKKRKEKKENILYSVPVDNRMKIK